MTPASRTGNARRGRHAVRQQVDALLPQAGNALAPVNSGTEIRVRACYAASRAQAISKTVQFVVVSRYAGSTERAARINSMTSQRVRYEKVTAATASRKVLIVSAFQ
jgi:hypothetical protein